LLVVQTYLTGENQTRLHDGIALSQQTVKKVSLVGELEKDVLDLQRFVLIFKQTGSDSILSRFEKLYKDINENLVELEELIINEDNQQDYQDLNNRMRSHLEDYKSNFATVVEGRSKRDAILEQKIKLDLLQIQQNLERMWQFSSLPVEQREALIKARYYVSQAQVSALNYLLSPEPAIIEEFQQQIIAAREQLQALDNRPDVQDTIESNLSNLASDFVQLTQVTRGYLFLVNVVMAGSANEFLYLAQELSQLVTTRQHAVDMQIAQDTQKAQIQGNIFAAITLLLFSSVALFFIFRVAIPINTMTELFKMLANQQDIEKVPLTHRKDEIGELAKAAEVFHDKNLQTNE